MPDKDKRPDSSKLISSLDSGFDSGTVDSGFGDSTIPGFAPDFQTGQYGGLSEMLDPALEGEFSAERTQTDLMMPAAQMHDDDTAERLSTLLIDCLGVLDDIDKLLKSARELDVDAKLIVELEATRQRFLGKLASHDVEHQAAAEGATVDVIFHEVIREVAVDDKAKHGKIVSIERAGYLQHGQPLRRARVVVGKKA